MQQENDTRQNGQSPVGDRLYVLEILSRTNQARFRLQSCKYAIEAVYAEDLQPSASRNGGENLIS